MAQLSAGCWCNSLTILFLYLQVKTLYIRIPTSPFPTISTPKTNQIPSILICVLSSLLYIYIVIITGCTLFVAEETTKMAAFFKLFSVVAVFFLVCQKGKLYL